MSFSNVSGNDRLPGAFFNIVWRDQEPQRQHANEELHASDFITWLRDNSPSLLKFRSVMPVTDVIESWFDQELKQIWRN